MLAADVVVVGAGSAGCALAARLSEDPHLAVALVEAGDRARDWWIDVPIGYFKTVGRTRFDWCFLTEPEAELGGRRVPWPRGKGLGGTSLINGMLYLRGHRADYDGWSAAGNAGWGWDEVLPLFKRSMHSARTPGPTDGTGGPLWVSDLPRDALSDAFVAAAGAVGIPPTADFNGGENFGAGYFRMTTRRGRRVSSARAYLDPAAARRNLTVLAGAHAARVVLDGARATGVEIVRGGRRETVRARHEVVLSAGAVQSPQLLQLSGVGDPRLLARHGVPVVADLPGVGRNLQDHLQLRPVFRLRGVETLNDIARSRVRSARELLTYLLLKRGALAGGVYRAGAFFRASDGAPWPDAQIHFGLVSFDRPLAPPHPFPGVTLSACLLRPASAGAVEIASADPLAPPRIRADYLREPADRALAVRLVRAMREIAAAAPLARYVEREHAPGAAARSDGEILDWIRASAASIFHPVGTCAMGPAANPGAVVDARLRVHGVAGLRVADASIMPRIVSGNTNAPAIMIGEKAAELVRAELR